MVTEGVAPQLIDNAAQQLGFPVGPIQLGDETSIDLGVRIMKATKAAMGNSYPASDADDLIFLNGGSPVSLLIVARRIRR